MLLTYRIIMILLTLTVLGCSSRTKEIQELQSHKNTSQKKEITSLIIDLKRVEKESSFLYREASAYPLNDPKRKRMEKERELLWSKEQKIIDRLIQIGGPVIPCALQILKEPDLSPRERF